MQLQLKGLYKRTEARFFFTKPSIIYHYTNANYTNTNYTDTNYTDTNYTNTNYTNTNNANLNTPHQQTFDATAVECSQHRF